MPEFSIRDHRVGTGAPLFVIAEIGLNHGGDPARALALVEAAARGGASAVKLQTLRADGLVAAHCPPPMHVHAASLREYLRRFELDEAAHRAVAARAHALGLAFLSTPFDAVAVDLLARVGCDAFKIASGDLTHHRLIARAATHGRPVLISTGMGSLEEAGAALAAARAGGAGGVALLHCVSAYPVPAGEQNLGAIRALATAFDVPVGLSDHGTDPMAAPLAVALGASVYEKHIVMGPGDDAVDAAVSATPEELARAVDAAGRARRAIGHGRKECLPVEAGNVAPSRRGLYAARDLSAGDVANAGTVVALRPAAGIPVCDWPRVDGRRVLAPIASGAALAWEHLERTSGD